MILNYISYIDIFRLVFLFILLINSTKYKNIKEINLEHKILRFNKYCKRYSFQLNENMEDKLFSYLNYTRFIKNTRNQTLIEYNSENEPKISFVSPVFNKENYLHTLIKSIQIINIEDFEIIFIDDSSEDNSINIINNFMKNDRRIKLIKNKINRGSLYSRALGAFNSKGDYIIFVDSDDIIISEGISKAYKYISSQNLSLIQYNSLIQINNRIFINHYYEKFKNIIITQPLLSYIFYFNNSTSEEKNAGLWDKIIKKEIVLKSINYIGMNYLGKNIKIENDVILLFSILQNSQSYQYIDDIGYYYIRSNLGSISNSWKNPKIANEIIKSILITIDFLYEKSGNSFLDKKICISKLRKSFKRFKNCFKYIERGIQLTKNLFNKLLNSQYILNKDKLTIIKIELEILSIQESSRYLSKY